MVAMAWGQQPFSNTSARGGTRLRPLPVCLPKPHQRRRSRSSRHSGLCAGAAGRQRHPGHPPRHGRAPDTAVQQRRTATSSARALLPPPPSQAILLPPDLPPPPISASGASCWRKRVAKRGGHRTPAVSFWTPCYCGVDPSPVCGGRCCLMCRASLLLGAAASEAGAGLRGGDEAALHPFVGRDDGGLV